MARTATSALTLTETVNSSCEFVGVSIPPPIIITPGTKSNSAQGSIQVVCGSGSQYAIALATVNTDGDGNHHFLKNGTAQVGYKISRDPGDAQPFGNTAGQNTESVVGTGQTQSIPFFVTLDPAPNNLPVGQYTDTVQVAVTF